MKATVIPVTPFAQNATVLWCEKTMKGAVSDPGGDLDKILAVVEKEGPCPFGSRVSDSRPVGAL
jgi:hydroxyacylglutathione hydrolase